MSFEEAATLRTEELLRRFIVARRVGEIDVPEAGVYEVALTVEAAPGDPVKLQWLWLAPEKGGRGGSAEWFL